MLASVLKYLCRYMRLYRFFSLEYIFINAHQCKTTVPSGTWTWSKNGMLFRNVGIHFYVFVQWWSLCKSFYTFSFTVTVQHNLIAAVQDRRAEPGSKLNYKILVCFLEVCFGAFVQLCTLCIKYYTFSTGVISVHQNTTAKIYSKQILKQD